MRRILIILFALLGLTATALAHSGATGIVKERMDQMKGLAQAMKAIGAMIKDDTPYDPAQVKAHAMDVMRAGGAGLTDLFPQGSTQHPSEATPQIWTDWVRFQTQAQAMQSAAWALANGAANPIGTGKATAPDALFQDLAQTCKACHQDFRIKK